MAAATATSSTRKGPRRCTLAAETSRWSAASRPARTRFYAGSGSNQIIGGGGNDTFVAGSGAATMTAGLGSDVFQFVSGTAGGTDLIAGFTSTDKLHLQGYGAGAIQDALGTQAVSAGSVTITLSDNTQVTLSGVDHLTRNNFS
jgi:Ca2+-binding RTX toxin-like protein